MFFIFVFFFFWCGGGGFVCFFSFLGFTLHPPCLPLCSPFFYLIWINSLYSKIAGFFERITSSINFPQSQYHATTIWTRRVLCLLGDVWQPFSVVELQAPIRCHVNHHSNPRTPSKEILHKQQHIALTPLW